MERFIRRENMKRFRKLLLEAKDDAERRRLQKLLIEEEQKESAAETPSPSTAPRLSDVSSRRLPALTANVSDTAYTAFTQLHGRARNADKTWW